MTIVYLVVLEFWHETSTTIGIFKTREGAVRAIRGAIDREGHTHSYEYEGNSWSSNLGNCSYEIYTEELQE